MELHHCDASSENLRALSSRGLKALSLGRWEKVLDLQCFEILFDRNCKLFGVRAQLLEKIALDMEEMTVESNDLTQNQWTGLLQGLAKAPHLKKLHVEPLPPKLTHVLVNLLEKASLKVTNLALATVWPGLLQSISDSISVTSLELHGVDLDWLDGDAFPSTLMATAFHKLTTLDISQCAIPVDHIRALLDDVTTSCLSELNLEGVENLKDCNASYFSNLARLDKLNLSNTGLSVDHYKAFFGRLMESGHRTKSGKNFPSELSLCSEQAICSPALPPYLHHIFAMVRVLNISNLNFKDDTMKKIFKRLTDENVAADLEELVICDTSLASLDQGLFVAAVLKLRKANIARFLLILIFG